MRKHFSKNMYKTIIHATVRLKESSGYGVPINKYDKRSKAAIDYGQLANEISSEEKKLRKDKSASFKPGPRQTKEGVLFTYSDPSARDVQLVGDFSDWEPMQNSMIRDQSL